MKGVNKENIKKHALNEFLSEYKELNTDNKYRPVAVGRYGIRKRESIYSKELAKDYSKNKLIHKDTLTVGMGSKQIDIGILIEDETFAVSPAYHTYKIQGIRCKYLDYCLQSKNIEMFSLYAKRGSRQGKSIDLKRWLTYKIPVYSEEDQIVIEDNLNKINVVIELRRKQLELLDELVRARFVEMFGEIEDCDKWESKIWNEVVTIKNGRDYKKVLVSDGGYPVVGTGGEIARASKYLCPENTIVVGRKGSINNPMLMKEKFWNVDTAFGVIPNSDYLHYQYFYCFCKFYNFMKLNKATTLPSTTKADLLKIRINIPPLELQNQFASFVQEIDKSRSRIQKSLEASQELFDSLMQEYFG